MFAQTLSEKEDLRLFFINEDCAFTDGKNIIVDPTTHDLYDDCHALKQTELFMSLPEVFSANGWNALKMITRSQNIHESLHIMYSSFPPLCTKDKRATSKIRQKVLSLIDNIIEDAYIEGVGCSIYDNLELFLTFGRISLAYAKKDVQGTAEKTILGAEQNNNNKKAEYTVALEKLCASLLEYLSYMANFLLYPMFKITEPQAEIAKYIEQTKLLFLDGSICEDATNRYKYSQKIFDIIEDLIPNTKEELSTLPLEALLSGTKTHNPNTATINNNFSKGKNCAVSRRLFTDLAGNLVKQKNFNKELKGVIAYFEKEKTIAEKIAEYKGETTEWYGEDFDSTNIHKGIKIIENKPKINLNLKKAYQNIYNKYRININSYNSRFAQLLKGKITVTEEKKLFGSGISSKRLGDVKKRYWYKNTEEYGVPDIAILLLVDGSGSMHGERQQSAMKSSIVLHEVLRKQGIKHAIIEHRGHDEHSIDINVLVDFNSKPEEKYNLLLMDAEEDNRDGLALIWAERYINQKSYAQDKLIIVLSDGVPAHEGNDYYPPVSVKDTANVAKKIIRGGTNIIAIALDDKEEYSCYNQLKNIYPYIVACNDLKRLTGQILTLVSRQLL